MGGRVDGRTGENKVNGLLWTWATTKEGVEEERTNNAKWREEGDLGRREKEKSLLEKQQTSTSGVNTHAVANTGASEKRWWSSIDKLLLGGDAEGGEEEEAPSTREEYSE